MPQARVAAGWRRAAGAAGLAAALLCTSGCAWLRGAVNGDAGDAAASVASAPAAPAIRLEVVAPGPLKALLEQHLDVARLQELPAEEALSPLEWARVIAAAPAQARELLQTEGYFEAAVRVERIGGPTVAAAAAADAGATAASAPAAATSSAAAPSAAPAPGPAGVIAVRVTVDPGPRTVVSALNVGTEGPLAEAAAADRPGARAVQQSLPGAAALQPGRPFRNPDWSDSKQQVLARLRAEGYASARLADSRADIDVPRQRAELAITADSGPLYRAGPLQIRGLDRHDRSTVENLAGFDAGAPLTEARLLDYQDRLQKTNLFQSALVSFDPDPAQAEATPVRVRLSELPLQQATVGTGISANTGPRVTLEHTHRRPFDWPVIAYNKLEWGRDSQGWTGDFQTHPGPGFHRNLLGGQVERVLSQTDVVLSQRLRLGRTQDTKRYERLYFLELLRSRKSEFAPQGSGLADAVTRASALTANYHIVWRNVDSVLLPTRGVTVALQAGAGQSRSHDADDGPFSRLYGRVTGYWPLGRDWYGQARLEAGQIIKRDNVAVPDVLGFRAGGDESVRGYAYRSLTPTDAGGNTVSGTSLLTASVELARPIVASLPSVWGAVFIDAGRAVNSWQDYKPALGYGVGVRWRSPIGPLRIDLAWADELKKARLHLSVGIAF